MKADKLYSSIARFYDWLLWLSGYHLAIRYFIRHIPLPTKSSITILDAGCGTGLYSLALLKRFPKAKLTAFDVNEAMIGQLKAKLEKQDAITGRLKFFTADLTGPLPALAGKFDLIVTGGVLEYVDIQQAVGNLSPYLQPDGLFLNVAVKNNLFGKLVASLYRLDLYTREHNIQAFTYNNFALVEVRQFPLAREAYYFRKTLNSTEDTDRLVN
jgi:ubiquinone/menaquinone biosynthesis C-methylase UbiE